MTHTVEPPLFMEAWVALLTAHARAVSRVSRDLEAACGISLVWFDVLFQLSVVPDGHRRMHELARVLLLSKSGLTRLVDRIQEAGLVARVPVPGDRRSFHVQLTASGRRLQDKARPIVRESVANRFASNLSTAELRTLRAALTKVVADASGAEDNEPAADSGRKRRQRRA